MATNFETFKPDQGDEKSWEVLEDDALERISPSEEEQRARDRAAFMKRTEIKPGLEVTLREGDKWVKGTVVHERDSKGKVVVALEGGEPEKEGLRDTLAQQETRSVDPDILKIDLYNHLQEGIQQERKEQRNKEMADALVNLMEESEKRRKAS